MTSSIKQQLLLLGIALLSFAIPSTALCDEKPNVVLIYADDVGFGDVGVNGSKLIPTPNIDRLASEGMNFTDAHSSASTCTPSRFSLLTGAHTFRHKVRILPPNAPLIIPTDIDHGAAALPSACSKAASVTLKMIPQNAWMQIANQNGPGLCRRRTRWFIPITATPERNSTASTANNISKLVHPNIVVAPD